MKVRQNEQPNQGGQLCVKAVQLASARVSQKQIDKMLLSVLKFPFYCIWSLYSLILDLALGSHFSMVCFSVCLALMVLGHAHWAVKIVESYFPQRTPAPIIKQQKSPINILRSVALSVSRNGVLQWFCYDELAPALLLSNNGKTVTLTISAAPGLVPYIKSDWFYGNYYFVEAVFKWGGAEHMIESQKFVLELQVLHATNIPNAKFEYVTVSYLFRLRPNYNYSPLNPIVDNLCEIVRPGSVAEIPPFDLETLLKPFDCNYYSYFGTYENGSTALRTLWLISPRTFPVGTNQLSKFNAICDCRGRQITRNSRRLQTCSTTTLLYNQYD